MSWRGNGNSSCIHMGKDNADVPLLLSDDKHWAWAHRSGTQDGASFENLTFSRKNCNEILIVSTVKLHVTAFYRRDIFRSICRILWIQLQEHIVKIGNEPKNHIRFRKLAHKKRKKMENTWILKKCYTCLCLVLCRCVCVVFTHFFQCITCCAQHVPCCQEQSDME